MHPSDPLRFNTATVLTDPFTAIRVAFDKAGSEHKAFEPVLPPCLSSVRTHPVEHFGDHYASLHLRLFHPAACTVECPAHPLLMNGFCGSSDGVLVDRYPLSRAFILSGQALVDQVNEHRGCLCRPRQGQSPLQPRRLPGPCIGSGADALQTLAARPT